MATTQAVPPVTSDDLEDAERYEAGRKEALVAMNRHKNARRIALADDISLLFEDRRTLKHQVQEMVRMESDTVDEVLKHYTDLQPDPRDLVATLFVEVQRSEEIRPRLSHYAGIERSIRLRIGDLTVKATPVGDFGDDQAATAVTYMRFRLPDEAWDRLPTTEVVLDHPNAKATVPLPDAVVADPHGVRS
ncbi:MAG: DUF3501 family protein [Euryarchaeota archaeon]|nr:DUF3501 family protein [Euryarchaeota archaeon]